MVKGGVLNFEETQTNPQGFCPQGFSRFLRRERNLERNLEKPLARGKTLAEGHPQFEEVTQRPSRPFVAASLHAHCRSRNTHRPRAFETTSTGGGFARFAHATPLSY